MAYTYDDPDFTIKIDEGTLTRLQAEYQDLAAEFKKRADVYPWAAAASRTIEQEFPLHAGGPAFTEAQTMSRAVEKIRKNLAERFQLTYGDSDSLSSGLKSLLAVTNLAEELNGMTAEEFASYIPQSQNTLTPDSES